MTFIHKWSESKLFIYHFTTLEFACCLQQKKRIKYNIKINMKHRLLFIIRTFRNINIFYIFIFKVNSFSIILCPGEEPIYANTRPVANRQPSPRVGTLTTNPKTVPSSMNHWTSGTTGRKYEQSTRRAKPTGGHRALV